MGRSVEAVMGTLRSVRHPEGGWVGRRGSRAWADRSVGLDLWRSRTPSREHGRRELEAQAPKSALLVTLAKSARRRTVWPWPCGAWAPAFTRRLARRPRSSGCRRRSRTRRGRVSPELGSARWRRDGSGAFPAVAGRRVEIAAAWIRRPPDGTDPSQRFGRGRTRPQFAAGAQQCAHAPHPLFCPLRC